MRKMQRTTVMKEDVEYDEDEDKDNENGKIIKMLKK